MLSCFAAVVDEAGAGDGVGIVDVYRPAGKGCKERAVALSRANAVDAPKAALPDDTEGQIARGDDGVPGLANYALVVEQAGDGFGRHRRIGDEYHRAAAAAKAGECHVGSVEGAFAVVYYAPDVAEQHVVTRQQIAAGREDGWGHAGSLALAAVPAPKRFSM